MTLSTTAPARSLAPSRRTDAKISARWREWCPAIRIWSQSSGVQLTAQIGSVMRGMHKSWLLKLLALGIEMRVIRRLELDDPRLPLSMLRERLRDYQQRSQTLRQQRPSRR